MSSGEDDPVATIKRGLMGYLAKHPAAADTPQGIQQWWLGPELAGEQEYRVVAALEDLSSAGLLKKTTLPDGTVIYAAAGCP